MPQSIDVQIPEKLGFLFSPYRYKVLYGGRGSGKSVNIVKALLILGMQKPIRILCGREVQKSIRDSVKALLDDEIELMGMTAFYESLDQEIRGANGTSFVFTGLSTQTVDSIKSFANCDICWVEEGQSVSKRSWDVLIPTIRNEGSEIWISMNPELETDETYQRFVANPPPNSKVAQVNYHDNPFFPDVLEAERIHCQLTAPKDYDNIWLGKCKPAVSGAIYYDEVASAEEGQRITNVPYDPLMKVHAVFDLGWNDAMAISLIQKGPADIRVIEYIEDSHKTLDHYSALLKGKNLNWGSLYLPHDGRNRDFKTGKSAEEIMTALGWNVKITPNMSIEDGIRLTRMTFPRMYFDKTKTERLVQCAKRYRRSINQQTNEPGAPMHDEWSHGADNLRYVAINAETMTNETWGGELSYPPLGTF
ncbi:MAG: PBSX family phage terminase large subunit [Pusillimonas sp.]